MVLGKITRKTQKDASRPGRTHAPSYLKNGSFGALSGMGSKAGTSSSRRVHHTYTSKNKSNGRLTTHQDVLVPSAIQDRQAQEYASFKNQVDDMTTLELAELHALRAIPEDSLRGGSTEPMIGVDDILAGTEAAEFSHAGGEWAELLAIEDELFGPSIRPRRKDYRTRRDRTQRRMDAFNNQMHALVDAYMTWMLAVGSNGLSGDYVPPVDAVAEGSTKITEMDIFRSRKVVVDHIASDAYVTSSMVRHGLIPCAPFSPVVAFTVRALEFYRVSHNRCPHISIHTFVKSLCDLYCSPFKRHLARQFSISYDLYLEIRKTADERVQAALARNTVDYRLQHACPTCTYCLKDEPKLKFSMLYTVDGNDSLKRIMRRDAPPIDLTADTEPSAAPVLPNSTEAPDLRIAGHGMYLTNEQVDKWSKEMLATLYPSYNEKEAEDDNPCAERWKNMRTELTAKMWGVFEESGLFLALCRHGFVLMLVDMVRSGELSKYPLAIVAKMLDVFGADLGLGYDTGCRFCTTLDNSPLGTKARENNHRCLVGAFHGHAHNRLCQSRFLATYVEGLGIEDLETCERFFSRSNALAGPTRHASKFHRRQAIAEFAMYNDNFETYQNLSTFLLNNYKQALHLLNTKPAVMAALEQVGGGNGDIVDTWLIEERTYLQGLSREPLEETLEMEYYTMVQALLDSEKILTAANQVWSNLTSLTISERDQTAKLETARRHAIEIHRKDLRAVQLMEAKMDIATRWRPEMEEWVRAEKMVSMRNYQRCLDRLEGLVVARMFELTKMNMSQTGYSLRKHIANSLKSRSAAIRTALTKYNAAANALPLPQPNLSWEEVVEYAFLADFDLLRDTRQDIRTQPWATPAARLAMDSFFKLCRAAEEIDCLNIEIRRFATFMRDETIFLRSKEAEVRLTNPALAYQVSIYQAVGGRYQEHHSAILNKITQLDGFTGGQLFGTHLADVPVAVECPVVLPPSTTSLLAAMETDDIDEDTCEQEQAEDDQEAEVLGAYYNILQMSYDGGH